MVTITLHAKHCLNLNHNATSYCITLFKILCNLYKVSPFFWALVSLFPTYRYYIPIPYRYKVCVCVCACMDACLQESLAYAIDKCLL